MSLFRTSSVAAFISTAILVATVSTASAVIVSVDAQSGPWSQAANSPAFNYGNGDNLAPTSVPVIPGTTVTITYDSGLTSSFAGVPASVGVDGIGYSNLIFGSGVGRTGIGSSGNPFPSFFIDPLNIGPAIYLNGLIGTFADGAGVIVGTPFSIGNGPLSKLVPLGAAQLLLGINDDIFTAQSDVDGTLVPDNTGSLNISVVVSDTNAVPLPAALPLFAGGIGLIGLLARRKKHRHAAQLP
jgi:hypothetical protein